MESPDRSVAMRKQSRGEEKRLITEKVYSRSSVPQIMTRVKINAVIPPYSLGVL